MRETLKAVFWMKEALLDCSVSSSCLLWLQGAKLSWRRGNLYLTCMFVYFVFQIQRLRMLLEASEKRYASADRFLIPMFICARGQRKGPLSGRYSDPE